MKKIIDEINLYREKPELLNSIIETHKNKSENKEDISKLKKIKVNTSCAKLIFSEKLYIEEVNLFIKKNGMFSIKKTKNFIIYSQHINQFLNPYYKYYDYIEYDDKYFIILNNEEDIDKILFAKKISNNLSIDEDEK